jgi:uncharacterized membrane protein
MKPKYLLPAIFSFILIILLPLLLYNKGSGTSEPNTTLSPSLTFIDPIYNRNASVAMGVSDDGSVVVGYSINANGVNATRPEPKTNNWESQRGFIWTSSSGARDLGSLGLERTWANAVSGDGKTVVGGYYTGSYSWRPFRWSADSGMKDLGTLGIDWADALDVSKDGSVIVGASYAPGNYYWWTVYGFRWTKQTGMVKLDTLPGYRFAHAFGVSEDGTKIVGLANKDATSEWYINQAVIWTSSGIRGLGSISNWYSQGLGISADGSTVIGILQNGTGPDPYQYPYRSFIWQQDKGMRVIETLGGDRTWVFHAVTRYGTEVFGASQNSNGEWRAFVWSENEGIRDLNLIYKDIIPSGWVLRSVNDCSPDGRFLVGMAEGPSGVIRAFLLDRKVSAPTQTPKPKIISIRDVPNDQGGKVLIRWVASSLDTNVNKLTHYTIWRAIPQPQTKFNQPNKSYRVRKFNGINYFWENIGSQPAHKLQYYAFTAQTLYDSMSTTDGKHYFFISAHTDDPNVFYDSDVDSGYSVDNLAPLPPRRVASRYENGAVLLTWDHNSETDLRGYLIYRSDKPGIDIYKTGPIATTRDSFYIDRSFPTSGRVYYVVAAQDIHDNISSNNSEVEIIITSVSYENEIPKSFILYQNYPNPFNPATTIEFDIPERTQVKLIIHDALGHEIKVMLDKDLEPGRYKVDFIADNLPSGIYLYTLKTPKYTKTNKMLLIK